MSRGFVKEEDQEEAPFIPPRASLPENTPNYVTVEGLSALKEERKSLEEERSNLTEANESERRKSLAVINGKLELLEERILSAQLIKNDEQPKDEVRFGAAVKFSMIAPNGKEITHELKIVGVDEADLKQKKAAFTAPIIKSLMGKRVGEEAEFIREGKTQNLKILAISYA